MTNEYRKIEVYNKYNKFINLSFKSTHEDTRVVIISFSYSHFM